MRKDAKCAGGAVLVVLSAFLQFSSVPPAFSAEYPRRIAIAPFVSLAQDDIRSTVAVLPRLLSSRLMAVAGAEVVLLPPGDKAPEAAAREAGVPLLLQGTVSKLGKGYSIDVTVTDLGTGKPAGGFFAAAASDDDIIPQLGVLAAELSEKLFGVKPATRAALPPPVLPTPPVSPAAALPSGATQSPPAPSALGQPTLAVAPLAAEAGAGKIAPGLKEGWVPTAIKKVSVSDKIVGEVYGVAAGDVDEEGNGEVVAYGSRNLYLYRIKATDILPYTRMTRGLDHHFLNVETADIDGDGKKEILVTDLVGERVESFILKRNGDVYEEVAGKIPYFLVVLPDWMGKRAVAGQHQGIDAPFQGKIFLMKWDGMALVEAEPLPANTNILPLSSGILGLSSARLGADWRLFYTDETDYLRVLDGAGKSEHKSRTQYGSAADFFEWGPLQLLEGKRKRFHLRKALRLAGEADGKPLFLSTEVKSGVLRKTVGTYDTTRVLLLRWEGSEFVEKADTEKSDHFYSGVDVLSPSGLRKGGKVIASFIESGSGLFKEKVSRLAVLQVD